jgi:hypothetical protein
VHRAKLDRSYSGGENPALWPIGVMGGEHPHLFPLGAARDPYRDDEGRKQAYEHDGVTKRVFPRGLPDQIRYPIAIDDLLHKP